MMRLEHGANSSSELQLLSKATGFLALLTSLLYTRAMIAQGTSAIAIGGRGEGGLWLLALLLLGSAGLLLAWWREGMGGMVALASALPLALLVYLLAGRNRLLAAFVYSSPFAIAGGLYVVCWWRKRRPA